MGHEDPVEVVDAAGFLAAGDELARLYAAVFGGPPWNEPPERAEAFRATLPGEAARPGFRAAFSRDGGGALAGFAYGFTTAEPFPSGRSYDEVRVALGAGTGELSGTFEVMELAVHPAARGGGHGRRLLAAVVGDRPAWLLTAEHAEGTVAFYDRLGWRRLGSANGILVYTAP
ncbi:GNAT family N-acetyltransferase [Dactylosporangium siamense]|uniref:N-acetyltransferase n=1 Tax=Dactylosporangium siamense TaxID=685454 RepID=A0A919UCE0_9ACTN|nr:GNAT family N-acetyltransferase [Dactylosporangium siamense]GIG45553.1 N-acetyltransferase [Dactylosporangium siamense]